MYQTAKQRARLAADLREKGIRDERVLAAIQSIPRHRFIPDDPFHPRAYHDVALPIGKGQTISQPFTVALMTELLGVRPGDRVLEVGTGSGYQAAVLVALGARVFSVERHEPLLARARTTLADLGVRVRTHLGDGSRGWLSLAPFDGIVVTAGGTEVPEALVDQLRAPKAGVPDARLVIPIGPPKRQTLHRITRTDAGTTDEALADVVFVPLVRGNAV